MSNINEAMESAWTQYKACFDALDKTPEVVRRIFDIGFVEGTQYAVRRIQTNVNRDKEQEPAHKDTA